MYQYVQKVHTPRAEHVVREDEVFLREALVCPSLTISSTSTGWRRQFVLQIPCMDEILMGYWVEVHMRTMRTSAMYKNILIIGETTLWRVLMITCDMFLSYYLRSTRSIDMLRSSRGIVDGHRDSIWQLC